MVREEEQTAAMQTVERDLANQRDTLKIELEHEQRVTMEVESWLRDRNAFLTQLHQG